jgi:predicted exporter
MRVARRIASMGEVLAGERVAVRRAELSPEARFAELAEVSQHIADLLAAAGVEGKDPAAIAHVVEGLSDLGGAGDERLLAAVRKRLEQDIVEDEYVYLRKDSDLLDLARLSADAIAVGTLTEDALYDLVFERASDEDRADPKGLRKAVSFLHGNLLAIQRGFRETALREAVAPLLEGTDNPRVTKHVVQAASVLLDEVAFLPAAAAKGLPQVASTRLGIEVSGYPVLYAGMNRSVQMNQILSTFISLGLVGLALWWVFRSLLLSLVAVVPAGLTLLVAFGIIGAFGLSLDIGMSMISAIAVGVGIDYAVHLLWKHGVPERDREDTALTSSLRATGWGVVINTLAVTAGFGLLVLSTVVPMQKFGVLTAACMLVSAVGSLLLIPALTRWVAPVVLRGWRNRNADHDESGKGPSGRSGHGARPARARGAEERRGGGRPEAPGADEAGAGRAADRGGPPPQRLR